MKEYAVRLTKDMDLKDTIESICQECNTAVVLSSVGSLSRVHVRLGGGQSYLEKTGEYEILSLNGTVSCGKAHLHMSFADPYGNVQGGHLMNGSIVNTTCELVLGVLEDYTSKRSLDEETGAKEITFSKK